MQGHYFDLVATGMTNRPMMVMEAKRHRLARELHDDFLQPLAALSLSIDLGGRLSSSNDRRAPQNELVQHRDCWEKSLSTVRGLVAQTSPGPRERGGLHRAMQGFARECQGRFDIAVTLDREDLSAHTLATEQSTAPFPIIQEPLRNASHHACASRVLVRAEHSADLLCVHVEHDSVGLDTQGVIADYPRRGLGWAGMQERAQDARGQLDVESAPGQGASVSMTIPLLDTGGL